jgi:hypothetical protein
MALSNRQRQARWRARHKLVRVDILPYCQCFKCNDHKQCKQALLDVIGKTLRRLCPTLNRKDIEKTILTEWRKKRMELVLQHYKEDMSKRVRSPIIEYEQYCNQSEISNIGKSWENWSDLA